MNDREGELAVGEDILAYCTYCKMDLNHVVFSKKGAAVAKVNCKTCRRTHRFVRPKSLGQKHFQDSPMKKKKTKTKKTDNHDELRRQMVDGLIRSYNISEKYSEGDYIKHGKFGLGKVERLIGARKIEVSFSDGVRIMVHARE